VTEGETHNDKVGRRSLRIARVQNDLHDDMESHALFPALVGGVLVVVAELVDWLVADTRSTGSPSGFGWAVFLIGVSGLALLLIGLGLALRFGYLRSRRDGRGRIHVSCSSTPSRQPAESTGALSAHG